MRCEFSWMLHNSDTRCGALRERRDAEACVPSCEQGTAAKVPLTYIMECCLATVGDSKMHLQCTRFSSFVSKGRFFFLGIGQCWMKNVSGFGDVVLLHLSLLHRCNIVFFCFVVSLTPPKYLLCLFLVLTGEKSDWITIAKTRKGPWIPLAVRSIYEVFDFGWCSLKRKIDLFGLWSPFQFYIWSDQIWLYHLTDFPLPFF